MGVALHTDDPDRDGNLSEEEYWRRAEERAARSGACRSEDDQ